ncbi:MAG TPA: hypothetical protein VIL20_10805 [Sandaracinaceae bacterium]
MDGLPAIRELREKYTLLRALRLEQLAGEAGDPRPRLRALAARFPGALRELDALPLERIEARIRELDEVLRGERSVPPWARLCAEYHAWMRAALAIRRAAGAARDRGRALAWLAFPRSAELEPSSSDLHEVLDEVLRPHGGRLNRWLFERLARRAGLTAAEVERLIFEPGPHRGRGAPV